MRTVAWFLFTLARVALWAYIGFRVMVSGMSTDDATVIHFDSTARAVIVCAAACFDFFAASLWRDLRAAIGRVEFNFKHTSF